MKQRRGLHGCGVAIFLSMRSESLRHGNIKAESMSERGPKCVHYGRILRSWLLYMQSLHRLLEFATLQALLCLVGHCS